MIAITGAKTLMYSEDVVRGATEVVILQNRSPQDTQLFGQCHWSYNTHKYVIQTPSVYARILLLLLKFAVVLVMMQTVLVTFSQFLRLQTSGSISGGADMHICIICLFALLFRSSSILWYG